MIVRVLLVMVVSILGFVDIFMATLDLGFRAGSGRSEFVEKKKLPSMTVLGLIF